MTIPSPDRWATLSPLLDELLDLAEPARTGRLSALRERDAALADELQALLSGGAQAASEGFLAGAVPLAPADGTATSLAGQHLGPYVLEEPLGQGGGGSVWRARREDGRFEGAVAIKLLHLSLLGRAGAERFRREGHILARLKHPHIASLLDAGVTPGGQPYLVLELVQGERIDRHCDALSLGIEARLALFDDVLAAVAHAHTHGVIHRDLKPGNILVTREGQVKLLDFGVAKLLDDEASTGESTELTRQGGRALTPEYAAPEQLRGEAVTTATDVYALGVLLYQLLSGQHPTAPAHGTSAEVIRSTLETEPQRLSRSVAVTGPEAAAQRGSTSERLRKALRGDLETIVAHALRKVPAERYSTVAALFDDLQRYQRHHPVLARPDSLGYVAGKFVRRHRGAVAAGALTTLAIVAGVAGTLWQGQRALAAAALAQAESARAIASAREAARQKAIAEEQFALAQAQSKRATQLADESRLAALRANAAAQQAREQRDLAIENMDASRNYGLLNTYLIKTMPKGKPLSIDELLQRATAVVTADKDLAPAGRSFILGLLGTTFMGIGEQRQARAALESALDFARQSGLASLKAASTCNLAYAQRNGGDLKSAAHAVDRALELLPQSPRNLDARIVCLNAASDLANSSGQNLKGIDLARKAVQLAERLPLPNPETQRMALVRLATSASRAGQPVLALSTYERAGLLLKRQHLEESLASAVMLTNWSSAQAHAGNALAADRLYQRVLDLNAGKEPGPSTQVAYAQNLFTLGDAARAESMMARAQERGHESGDKVLEDFARFFRVGMLRDMGRINEARQLLIEARAQLGQHLPPQHSVFQSVQMEQVHLARGDGHPEEALTLLSLLIDQMRAANAPALAVAKMRIARSALLLELGRWAQAKDEIELSLTTLQTVMPGSFPSSFKGDALVIEARLLAKRGLLGESRLRARQALRHYETCLGANHPKTRSAQELLGGAIAEASHP